MSDKIKISIPRGENANPVTTLLYNTIREANEKIGCESKKASETQMDLYIPKAKKGIVEKVIKAKAAKLLESKDSKVKFAANELNSWADLIKKTV